MHFFFILDMNFWIVLNMWSCLFVFFAGGGGGGGGGGDAKIPSWYYYV